MFGPSIDDNRIIAKMKATGWRQWKIALDFIDSQIHDWDLDTMQKKLKTVEGGLAAAAKAVAEYDGVAGTSRELSRIEFQVLGFAGAVWANTALMRARSAEKLRQWNAYLQDKPGWVVICICRETEEQGVLLREMLTGRTTISYVDSRCRRLREEVLTPICGEVWGMDSPRTAAMRSTRRPSRPGQALRRHSLRTWTDGCRRRSRTPRPSPQSSPSASRLRMANHAWRQAGRSARRRG